MIKEHLIIFVILITCANLKSQDLILEPNTFMLIESATTLSMGDGNVIVKSDASGDAALIDLGNISYSGGTTNVERFLSEGEWHLISSPVTGALSGMFLNDYLQSYAENTNLYTEIFATDVLLNIMEGYALWTADDYPSTETFIGTTNTGNMSFNFTKSDLPNDDNEGWNLIGNPFPSSIDWDAVTIPANLSGAIWIFDPDLGALGSYRYYINGGGISNTTSQYIPLGQGFFVKALGGNGTLNFTNSARVFNSQSFFKNSDTLNDESFMLALKAKNEDFTTQTTIRFNQNATSNVDRLFDVPCILSTSTDVVNIYSYCNNEKMSINTYSQIQGNEVVSFYIQMGESKEITLFVDETYSIPSEYPIYLEDVSAQVFQNLRTQSRYVFDYESNEIKEFKIHFKDVTGIGDMDSQFILAYIQDDYLNVNFYSQDIQAYHLTVYSLSGQLLYILDFSEKQLHIPFPLSSGIYILKIENSKFSYQQKLIKK